MRALAILVLLLTTAPMARADIYKLVDAQGVVHLSDRPMGPGSTLILRSMRPGDGRRPAGGANLAHNRRRYGPLVDRVAERYQLDRSLVHAVVRAESAYDPHAVSKRGAVGLMQLMPATAQRYGVRDRRNPAQNLAGGVRYLRDLLLRFDDVVLALAAYNAGESAVAQHGNKVPPFAETRSYVRRVLTFYRQMRSPS
jgi:soluble lytic murein transglycosylase-like protein